jgi:hypothetical protein
VLKSTVNRNQGMTQATKHQIGAPCARMIRTPRDHFISAKATPARNNPGSGCSHSSLIRARPRCKLGTWDIANG